MCVCIYITNTRSLINRDGWSDEEEEWEEEEEEEEKVRFPGEFPCLM